jgi:ubiquinone biosynthesis monooxygenase Coq6
LKLEITRKLVKCDSNKCRLFLAKNETLADKKVLLLEGAPAFKEPSKDKYSNRVSAINKQSIGLLKKLDAWSHIESIRCKHIMQMQVWDAISNETIHFNHPNFNDKVACIVENDLILEALYRQLSNLLNVQVKNQSRLETCKLPKDGAQKSEVTLKSGEQFTCDLLVSFSLFIQFLCEFCNAFRHFIDFLN